MVGAAAFDTVMFASILKSEVEHYSEKNYNGVSPSQLEKGFAFWCVKNISPLVSDDDAKEALLICQSDGPDDDPINGAWIDGNNLYLMQSEYVPPQIPATENEEFQCALFDSTRAEELQEGFHRIIEYYYGGPIKTSRKLILLTNLYRQAITGHKKIRLLITNSGAPNTALLKTRDEIIEEFEQDRARYAGHHCIVDGLEEFNQIVSDNQAKTPGDEYLEVEQSFEIPDPNGGIYALAATVDAKELIRIRDYWFYQIYHSNFRYLLKKQGVARPKIEHTLSIPSERGNFWRYNNGITICCKTLTVEGHQKYKIVGLQVVNGLQTIETLYDNRNNDDYVKDVKLLVRVIPTGQVPGAQSDLNSLEEARKLELHIAEYSNSQTQITARDLRSNDEIQRAIERILMDVYGLKYVRKIGEEKGARRWPTKYRVDNLDAAQAALSFWLGMAHEATNKARLIFEEENGPKHGYYEKVFTNSTTAEYVLFPYLLWKSQNILIGSPSAAGKIPYENLDLLALSVIGSLIKDIWNLMQIPSRDPNQDRFLKCAVTQIRTSTPEEDRKIMKMWRPVFQALSEVVRELRRDEAHKTGKPVNTITERNVIMKMHYTDQILRKRIMNDFRIRSLRKELRQIFPC